MKPEVQINLENLLFYGLQFCSKFIQCKNARQKIFIISFTWNIHLCNCFSCVVFSKRFINLIIESFLRNYFFQSAWFFSITFKNCVWCIFSDVIILKNFIMNFIHLFHFIYLFLILCKYLSSDNQNHHVVF